jgi:hypothetical protein
VRRARGGAQGLTRAAAGVLTRVCANPDEGAAAGKPRVVAVTKRTDQILLTVQNFDMWGATGFLSRVFSPFGTMGAPPLTHHRRRDVADACAAGRAQASGST